MITTDTLIVLLIDDFNFFYEASFLIQVTSMRVYHSVRRNTHWINAFLLFHLKVQIGGDD